MNTNKFLGTDLEIETLTKWILAKYSKFKVTEIRYFGSRINGKPRTDSDFDTYIVFKGKSPSGKPIFTELYNHNGVNYQIEFHAFLDFNDNYVPTHLVGDAMNVLQAKSRQGD
jgi:predicted nucleotidyltransferase